MEESKRLYGLSDVRSSEAKIDIIRKVKVALEELRLYVEKEYLQNDLERSTQLVFLSSEISRYEKMLQDQINNDDVIQSNVNIDYENDQD